MSNSIRTDHHHHNHHHHHHHSRCKKRKRGETRVFRFKTFGENGHPAELNEPSFRQNVRKLLEFGHFESSDSMASWSFQLEIHRHPPLHVLLFVVEEPIEASMDLHCKHCQYIGWGNQMICNKKYHFVIPSKDTMAAFLESQDPNYSLIQRLSNFVGLQGHVLHGLFHSNGFGHLLSLNGFESGSDLSGQQVMDLWDRLCTGLRARKVGLNDMSHKRGMELRLLHGVANGEPWFGRWGYRFGSGTYGVTHQIYQEALEAIRNVPLCLLNHHLTNISHEISMVFSKYQTLSNDPLITLHDLFLFILGLHSRLPKETYTDSQNQIVSVDTNNYNCRWSQKRIQMAIKVIIESLKRVECRWISRQEVRDAARIYIGDTGLLDFVLKSLGNQIVGNYLVRRSLNPVKKVLEYCLEDISNRLLPSHHHHHHELVTMQSTPLMAATAKNNNGYYNCKVTRAQVMKDIIHLYKYILMDYKGILSSIGLLNTIPMASRVILDAKYFIKEYYDTEIIIPTRTRSFDDMGFDQDEERLKLFCTVVVKTNNGDHDHHEEESIPPYECIIIKKSATFNDLYKEVERVFKEIYWKLRDVEVESVVDMRMKRRDEIVMREVEDGRRIVFEGKRKDEVVMVKEAVGGSKMVECGCGAKQEDGERMVCCDICEVWQHTRCVNIPNNEEVPHIFLCKRCDQEILPLSSLP